MNRLVTFVLSAGLVITAAIPWTRLVAGHAVPARRYDTAILGSPVNPVAVIGDSYTAGTDEGGRGPDGWTERAWQTLAERGVRVAADVAAEGRAGYGVRGDRGSTFADLSTRAVHPDDVLVVFFGSRNDQRVDPARLSVLVRDTFGLARQLAPTARLLVVGPPWPTAEVPEDMLRVRDVVGAEARAVGAEFVDPIADRWFVDRPDLIGSDGVHPTDAGHDYMADLISPVIAADLPARG